MGEAEARGEVRMRGWLGAVLLAILVTPAAALWLDIPGRSLPSSQCAPGEGDWAEALAKASEAATRGQPTVALRCAYRAFLEAEATGDAVAMVRVGDFFQNLGVQRYLKLSVRSAYLRAADHARRTQEWPVLAAVAIRLFAMGAGGGTGAPPGRLSPGGGRGTGGPVRSGPAGGDPDAARPRVRGPIASGREGSRPSPLGGRSLPWGRGMAWARSDDGMVCATGRDAGRKRLLRARRSLFVELGRKIFRLRPRDPQAARGVLEAIGRRAFVGGWSRHHPDLLPLHQRLLQLQAALARARRDGRRGRRKQHGRE